MPAIYDRIERCWRAEDHTGQIVGYYTSEAAALAALQPAEQGDNEDAFRELLQFIDLLVDLHEGQDTAPRI
jgi:hypothetical protein